MVACIVIMFWQFYGFELVCNCLAVMDSISPEQRWCQFDVGPLGDGETRKPHVRRHAMNKHQVHGA